MSTPSMEKASCFPTGKRGRKSHILSKKASLTLPTTLLSQGYLIRGFSFGWAHSHLSLAHTWKFTAQNLLGNTVHTNFTPGIRDQTTPIIP